MGNDNEKSGFEKLNQKLKDTFEGKSASDLEIKNDDGNYWQKVRRTSDLKDLIKDHNEE